MHLYVCVQVCASMCSSQKPYRCLGKRSSSTSVCKNLRYHVSLMPCSSGNCSRCRRDDRELAARNTLGSTVRQKRCTGALCPQQCAFALFLNQSCLALASSTVFKQQKTLYQHLQQPDTLQAAPCDDADALDAPMPRGNNDQRAAQQKQAACSAVDHDANAGSRAAPAEPRHSS